MVIGALLCVYTGVYSQVTSGYVGSNVSYVRSWVATAPESSGSSLVGRPLSDVKQSTDYYDGLGRLVQRVAKQGSYDSRKGSATDMVSTVVYLSLIHI